MKKIRIIFLAILFLLVACNGWAATYYVAQTAQVAAASDSNAGTDPAAPWETIAKVAATVTNGDIVYFHSASTWTGATPILTGTAGVKYYGASWGGGTRATFQATSAVDSYGIIRLFGDNITFDGFKIDGNELYTTGIQLGYRYAGNITGTKVNNCEVTNTGSAAEPADSYWYYGIHVAANIGYTLSNVEVTNCIVHDVGHEGIAIYPQYNAGGSGTVNNALIRNCEVYGTGLNAQRGHPIYIANDVDNVTVEFCYLHDSDYPIGITEYNYTTEGSPDNLIIRYNYLYNTLGIAFLPYSGMPGYNGYGAIYGNISYGGGLAFKAANYNSKSWVVANNIFEVDYPDSKSSYALDCIYNSNAGFENVVIKNNIFVQNANNLYVVRDNGNFLSDSQHSNNLFFNRASTSYLVTTSVLSDANAIPATSVAVTNSANYTFFTGTGTTWASTFSAGNFIQWSGFSNSVFNNRRFQIVSVTDTEIKIHNVWGGASGPTETATVTGEKWVAQSYSAANIAAGSYDTNAQTTNPTFTGGDLPTGFSGTYGTNMVPNTTYFAITSGNALGNGAVLSSPYNKAINNAGTDSTYTRGTAWDIGAYEYTLDGGATIVNTGAVFSGCTF